MSLSRDEQEHLEHSDRLVRLVMGASPKIAASYGAMAALRQLIAERQMYRQLYEGALDEIARKAT